EINRLHIERVRRFSMPFASLFLALMAMPLGIQPPRAQKSWGITISVCLGILVFLGYYGLLTIGIILSEAGSINPHLGLWLPNVVVAIFAAYSLHKMGSEKWQSILHGFENLLHFAANRINLWQRA
ncbi:MAG: LptF/LptG family permease, partial [Deltaproteobacteria bacterium]|nr:LptF/LptG family permease [Deltaproteobacteria bacterium]